MNKIENELLITLNMLTNRLDKALITLNLHSDNFRSYEWLQVYGLYILNDHSISMEEYKKKLTEIFPNKSEQFIKVQTTRRCAKLIANDYVYKIINTDDKRKYYLKLTSKGIKVVKDVIEQLNKEK